MPCDTPSTFHNSANRSLHRASNPSNASPQSLTPDAFDRLVSSLSVDPFNPSTYDALTDHFAVHSFTLSPSESTLLQAAGSLVYQSPLNVGLKILDCLQTIIKSTALSILPEVGRVLISSADPVVHGSASVRVGVALKILSCLTSRLPSLSLDIFASFCIPHLMLLIATSEDGDIQEWGMRLFHNLAFYAPFPPDLGAAFLRLCRVVLNSPGHAGIIPAVHTLKQLAIDPGNRNLIISEGFLLFVNSLVENRDRSIQIGSFLLMKELLNADGIEDDVNFVPAVAALISPDEELAVAGGKVIATYVRKYSNSIPALVALDIGQHITHIMRSGSVRAKIQAVCIFTEILRHGDVNSKVRCISEDLIFGLIGILEAIPRSMIVVIRSILERLVTFDIEMGGSMGVVACLRSQDIQNLAIEMIQLNSGVYATVLEIILNLADRPFSRA
jgi:hypothetical protein